MVWTFLLIEKTFLTSKHHTQMSLKERYLLATLLYLLLFCGVFSRPTCFFNKHDELNNMLFLRK